MKKGGSNRFSTPTRRTGVDSDVFLDKSKSSKKEKLRRLSCVGILGEMDQLSHSISANSTTKRVKLPDKFSDHCGTTNHATAPRKLRSAMKKGQYESQKICAVNASRALLDSRNEIGGFELRSKDCTKKYKAAADECEGSKMPLREYVLTKDEEEVAEALFAMAQTCNTVTDLNGISKLKPSLTLDSLVHQDSMHMEPPNEAEATNGITNKKSRERCSSHIYICHFIKALQTMKGNGLGVDEGSKRGACVNVTFDTHPQKITNEYTDKRSSKVEICCKGMFQEHQQAFDVVNRRKTTNKDTSMQLQDLMGLNLTNPHSTSFDGYHLTPAVKEVLPYFDTMDHDHCQWSTNMLYKQQSWGNQFTSTCCYQNWQSQRLDAMTPLLSCSVETFGLKYTQGSLLKVLGSEHALNKEEQCISMSLLTSHKGKMLLSDHPSGYEKGGLYFLDSGPILELTL